MQSLYEQHKALTYPRTDSRYLSSDIVDTLAERVRAVSFGTYSKFATAILKEKIKTNASFVDDRKVTDHHAIIPTEQSPIIHKLSDRERKVYDLVVKRFLAVLLPPFEYEQTNVTATIGGETFVAKGKVVLAPGWKEVYGSYDEEELPHEELADQVLPKLTEGSRLNINAVRLTSGKLCPRSGLLKRRYCRRWRIRLRICQEKAGTCCIPSMQAAASARWRPAPILSTNY